MYRKFSKKFNEPKTFKNLHKTQHKKPQCRRQSVIFFHNNISNLCVKKDKANSDLSYRIKINGGIEYKSYESDSTLKQTHFTCPNLCSNKGICLENTNCQCLNGFGGVDCGYKLNSFETNDEFGYANYGVLSGRYTFLSIPRSSLVKKTAELVFSLQNNRDLFEVSDHFLSLFFSVGDEILLPNEFENDFQLDIKDMIVVFRPSVQIQNFFDKSSEEIYIGKKYFKFFLKGVLNLKERKLILEITSRLRGESQEMEGNSTALMIIYLLLGLFFVLAVACFLSRLIFGNKKEIVNKEKIDLKKKENKSKPMIRMKLRDQNDSREKDSEKLFSSYRKDQIPQNISDQEDSEVSFN